MRNKIVEKTLVYSIKSLREIRQIKQGAIASNLFVDQSVYSRMENMEIPLTMTKIHTICCYLAFDTLTFLSIVLIVSEFYQINNQLPDKDSIKSLIIEILNEDLVLNFNQISTIRLRVKIQLIMQKLHKNFVFH
jgi:transcriptional regulator with XRE-family HTH domain